MKAPQTSSALEPIPVMQDNFSGGMRDREHPSQLLENELASITNGSIREEGLIQTRAGTRTATTVSPGANPQGVIEFKPVAVDNMLVQVNDGKFWKWVGTGEWVRVGTTQLSNRTGQVAMVIISGVLYVHSGSADNAYSWDGAAASFSDEGNTNADSPLGNIACQQAGRDCVAGVSSTAALTDTRDYIFFSDIFDGHTYDRVNNSRRVPTANYQAVTAMEAYRQELILSWTLNSTHLYNVTGSSVTAFTRQTLDPKVGCLAPKSVAVVGDDAFFMSADRHIRTIKRTVQDIAFGVSIPITYQNTNLVERINEAYASGSVGIFFDNYYLVAVPMDSNTKNSSVIAFDTLHQKQGPSGNLPSCVGEWTGLAVGAWVIGTFAGKQKLYFIDANNGQLVQMFNAESDDGNYINFSIDLRAPSWGAPQNDKTLHSGELQLLETFGTTTVSYAKDDGVFTALISKVISDSGSRLPLTLPFVLTAGGVLAFLPLTFYRRGRSRYWQLRISHTNGVIKLKQATLRGWIEALSTRGF